MADDTNKKKNFFGRALDYLVNSYQSQVAAQNQANQMLADNFDNNPKEQKQLREEMLNRDYGAAMSLGSEETQKLRNVVGDAIADVAFDQTVGKGIEFAGKKVAETAQKKIGNKILLNKIKLISGQPDEIIPSNQASKKILNNMDFNPKGLEHFDELNRGEGISYITKDFFDTNYAGPGHKSSLKQLEKELNKIKFTALNGEASEEAIKKAYKLEEEINQIKTKNLFDKTQIRHKLRKADGTIINKTSTLSDFLPQKTIDLDGNINVKPKAKIFDEGIPLNHKGEPFTVNDAFRQAFQNEDVRKMQTIEKIRSDVERKYGKEAAEYILDGTSIDIDNLFNNRLNFRKEFPYEKIGLNKEVSESLPQLYNENLPKSEINKRYNDYFNSLDFSIVEHEAMKEGSHINNRLAGGMSSPEKTKEWLSNMLGTTEKTAELSDLYDAADQIKNLSKNKGFKATMYGLVNFLSKGAYDKLRDLVPPYQETTARDITAWLYNKGWIESEDELIDLIDKMDRDTYLNLIAPIAAIELSNKAELKEFLRYKPAFYHNVIKNNKLYPGWKEKFDNSVSGVKENSLLKNYKDSDYSTDSNGNLKLNDWKMTDTEYKEFKDKLKEEKRLRTIAPRG